MKGAYHVAKSMSVPVDKAARLCGVPTQTHRDRIKGYVDPRNCKTMLTREQEEVLVNHV